MGLLSPEEKIYIVHGVEQNVRTDGRSRLQYRPLELETDLIPTAMGSSRVKIGTTDVLVSVRANTATPSADKPNEGQMELLVHFSCVADPEYEGRNSEQLRDQYTHIFNKLYSSIKFNDWCIVEKVKCWKFNVDVCIVSLNGNLYDAVGLAVKSALASAVIPSVKVSNQDKGEMEFSISDDPSDSWMPDVSNIPIFVTISKIGDGAVVDPTAQEEQCTSSNCIVACNENGKKCFIMKSGMGSVHPTTLSSQIECAQRVGVEMNKELNKLIAKTKSLDSREIFGYL